MSELRDRRVKVVVAQPAPGDDYKTFSARVTEIEDLRVRFTVTLTSAKEPNTAEITVSNLAGATRAGLQKASKVLLLAGYRDTLGQIFYGDLRSADHVHQGPDWDTALRCGDGERAIKHARVAESLPPGVPVKEALEVIGRATGHNLGNLLAKASQVAPGEQYTQGLAAYGPAMPLLAKILEARGYEVSVQAGKLQVLARGEATSETAILLTPETGLLGSPEIGSPEKKGGAPVMKFRSLLQADLRPGRKIEIRSKHVNGVFIARKIVHQGDTAGGEWQSDGEAVAA